MENSQEPGTTADDGAPVELPSSEVPPAEEPALSDPPASEEPPNGEEGPGPASVPAPAAAPAVASRSRLSKQSPGFGVFARAAAQAAADTPVLDDPYWLPPEPNREAKEEVSRAQERLRKVTILALSEADAAEGVDLATFSATFEQLHQNVTPDMALCGFASVADMLKAESEVARLDAEAQRVFPVDLPEDEFAGEAAEGFQLSVDRSNGGELGLKVGPSEDPMALEIIRVHDEGLVKEWCQKRPLRKVMSGDRILAVNGRRGSSKQLVAMLRQTVPLVLLIQRKCHAKPRGGKGGGKGKAKGRGREARQHAGPNRPPLAPLIPGAAAKSRSQPLPRFMANGWHRNGGRGRSRSRDRRPYGRREDSHRRPKTARPMPPPKALSPEELEERKALEILSHIARGLVCGVCMGPMTATCGTLDLRKCGHRVHAECLIGAERDSSGHPRCQACNTQAQLGQRFREREAREAAARKAEAAKAPREERARSRKSRKRSRRRRRSRSSSGRGRRRSRRTRHRSRQSSESSATSTSRSDGDSSGEGSQNSSDSKPPGNLMAIRGSSRFCSVCGQHLGWVEKSSTGATQKAPEPICSSCQAKAVEKAAEAPVAEAAKPAESEEEGMEVDEWGFQMALDQVKEAACADDALAVMEALVDSKPSAEFLEAASWSTKLSEVQSSPSADLRVVACAKRLASIWERKKRGEEVGPADVAEVPASVAPTESAEPRAASEASGSDSPGSDGGLGWTCATTAEPVEDLALGAAQESPGKLPVSQESSTTDPDPQSGPAERGDAEQAAPLNSKKGFLAGLLERARRKAKDKIVAAATALVAVGSDNELPATPKTSPVPESPEAAPGQWVAPDLPPLPPLLSPPPFAWPYPTWPPAAPVPRQAGPPY